MPLTDGSVSHHLGFRDRRLLGARIVRSQGSRLLNRRGLARTQAFYQRHGGKTIVLARFVPIVRTFAPFVAGLVCMSYPRFLAVSASGATLWVTVLVLGGYWFGNLPLIKEHFSLLIMAIIVLSLTPLLMTYARSKWR